VIQTVKADLSLVPMCPLASLVLAVGDNIIGGKYRPRLEDCFALKTVRSEKLIEPASERKHGVTS